METFLGDIKLFAFDYAPQGWMTCEGQTMNIVQNQALYALLGTRFGGNGSTTFCLPDLRNALPMQQMGIHYCINVYNGIYPYRG